MKFNKLLFILTDLLTAGLAWLLFYFFRIYFIENSTPTYEGNFVLGICLVPLMWILLYAIQGTYLDLKRRYRLKTIKLTLFGTAIGATVVFFGLLLNDYVQDYTQFYLLFFGYFGIHFSLTLLPRLISTTIYVKKIHKGEIGFNTVIIGGSDKALEILEDLNNLKQNPGYKFIGYININGNDHALENEMPYLGHINDVHEIVQNNKIEEVIIALESSEHEKLKGILSTLTISDLKISIIPDAYDILSGSVKMNSIFGALLINVTPTTMPDWQFATKRIFDVFFSLIAIILLIPVYLMVGLLVKFSSKGPIFFTQERIGKKGKPFQIIKFRTMKMNAETTGPQLSSSNDPRITKIGKFLRKTRIDEFPQFWNVIKGDMSLVGPRPERQFFIDQISSKDPQYLYLHKVRPGITSWGQVKFGYAENVEQMIQRMKYDLLYIRNMSLALDFKILFYTIAVIFKGSGK